MSTKTSPRLLLLTAALLAVITSGSLLAASCSAGSPASSSTQPMAYTTGTTPVRGILSEFTSSSVTLDTATGRLALQYDSSTVTLMSGVTGALDTNYLKPGMEVIAYYYPANNLAAEIQFLLLPYTVSATGTVVQLANPSITLSTGSRPLTLTAMAGVIVVRKDGSPGTMSDLTTGMNIRVFFYPIRNTALAIEIQ